MPGEGRTTGQTPAVTAIKIGYARVSTDGQDLTAQRQALAALGVQPDRVYVDHGITGTHRQRPGLREALAACRPGDTLVVTKLDRLARSVPDARDIVDELTACGVRLDLGGSVHDLTDPIGRLLFSVLSMIAEFEADLARARTREGMAVAKALVEPRSRGAVGLSLRRWLALTRIGRRFPSMSDGSCRRRGRRSVAAIRTKSRRSCWTRCCQSGAPTGRRRRRGCAARRSLAGGAPGRSGREAKRAREGVRSLLDRRRHPPDLSPSSSSGRSS